MSRKGGRGSDMRKDFKRMNTNMSRMSRTSRVSRGSGKSQWSGKSRAGGGRRHQGGFFSHYAENAEEEEKENPFDAIFGKEVYKKMKGNRDYVEKMSLAEFRSQVPWGANVFPQFIVDLLAYISGFRVDEFVRQKQQREKEEQENQQLQQLIAERREAGEKVDENFLMEQLKRQRMSDADAELVTLRNRVGDRVYRKLVRFFRNVARNPAEKESALFLTQESIAKKLKNHFGHKCEFLANRLYFLLSGHVNLKRVGLKDFIEKTEALWTASTTAREANRFAFQLLDIDHDGVLNGPDLLAVQEQVDAFSPFGQELQALVDHYVSTYLMVKNRTSVRSFLHLDTYMLLLDGRPSVLFNELRLKVLAREGKHKGASVLFRDDAKEEEMRKRRQQATVQA